MFHVKHPKRNAIEVADGGESSSSPLEAKIDFFITIIHIHDIVFKTFITKGERRRKTIGKSCLKDRNQMKMLPSESIHPRVSWLRENKTFFPFCSRWIKWIEWMNKSIKLLQMHLVRSSECLALACWSLRLLFHLVSDWSRNAVISPEGRNYLWGASNNTIEAIRSKMYTTRGLTWFHRLICLLVLLGPRKSKQFSWSAVGARKGS